MSTDEIKSTTGGVDASSFSAHETSIVGGSTTIRPINLKHLVNLALSSSPKAGVVNFNLLKVFLLELLKALNLQNHEFKFDPKSTTSNTSDASMLAGLIDPGEISQSLLDSGNQSLLPSYPITTNGNDSDRLRALEDKMGRMESQFMAMVNSMPNNQTIIQKAKQFRGLSSSPTPTGRSGAGGRTSPGGSGGSGGSGGGGGVSSSGPILEIWQYTQISKRMDASEDGLSRLSSLLQDLINDMSTLKRQQEKNVGDIRRIDDSIDSILDRLNGFERLKESLPTMDQFRDLENELEALKRKMSRMDLFDDKLKELTDQIKSIEKRIYEFVTHPDLEMYVTWPGLENCLKGLREALDSVKQREDELAAAMLTPRASVVPPPPPPNEPKFTQTTPIPPIRTPSRVQSPVVSSQQPPEPKYIRETVYVTRPSSQHGIHPTKELQDILSKLGTLNERHEKLRELVEKLRFELGNKLDKSDYVPSKESVVIERVTTQPAPPPPPVVVDSFKLPDDFGQKMEDIRKIMAMLQDLKNNFGIETNRRLEMEKMLANLNNEIENIKDSLRECLKNTQLNSNEIQNLKEAIRLLEETKADKDWVRGEFERKADKKDLDLKVNKKTFDESLNDVSNSINGCIAKNACLEEDWRKGSEKLFKELENKLDRLELNSLKDYIEKQLKKLKKLQKEGLGPIQALPMNPEDDAAGLRKPLLRFHCLSCDRPLEITHQHSALPSLPAERGIRPIQTPRPYHTFELDQIRQFQKQQMLQDPLTAGYDLYATVRQCGGPHTLTLPQKKLYKLAAQSGLPPGSSSVEEVTYTSSVVNPGTHKNEVQLQGQDGHIYKGRIDARLSVEMKRKMKNSTPSGGGMSQSAAYQRQQMGGSSAHHSSHHHNLQQQQQNAGRAPVSSANLYASYANGGGGDGGRGARSGGEVAAGATTTDDSDARPDDEAGLNSDSSANMTRPTATL